VDESAGAKADLEIVDQPERRRWEATEGDQVVGYAEYRTTPGRVAKIE